MTYPSFSHFHQVNIHHYFFDQTVIYVQQYCYLQVIPCSKRGIFGALLWWDLHPLFLLFRFFAVWRLGPSFLSLQTGFLFFSWVQLLVAYRSFHDYLCLPALPALFLLSSCPSSGSILNCRCVAVSKRVHIPVLQQKSKISFDD